MASKQLTFEALIAHIKEFTPRPEIDLEEVPAPQKLATYAFAFNAYVTQAPFKPEEHQIANGRFVILHEPGGQDSWEGEFRCVSFMRAEVDSEMQEDPLLPEVGWNWLLDSLKDAGAEIAAPSGTVTRVSSASFGKLSSRHEESDIEIRASWTPLLKTVEDLDANVAAWCNFMSEVAGLPPLADGVTSIHSARRRG
jgi:hypothetical protein